MQANHQPATLPRPNLQILPGTGLASGVGATSNAATASTSSTHTATTAIYKEEPASVAGDPVSTTNPSFGPLVLTFVVYTAPNPLHILVS